MSSSFLVFLNRYVTKLFSGLTKIPLSFLGIFTKPRYGLPCTYIEVGDCIAKNYIIISNCPFISKAQKTFKR